MARIHTGTLCCCTKAVLTGTAGPCCATTAQLSQRLDTTASFTNFMQKTPFNFVVKTACNHHLAYRIAAKVTALFLLLIQYFVAF
jgi:hypothetical protein